VMRRMKKEQRKRHAKEVVFGGRESWKHRLLVRFSHGSWDNVVVWMPLRYSLRDLFHKAGMYLLRAFYILIWTTSGVSISFFGMSWMF
jgi:hypothetical protein